MSARRGWLWGVVAAILALVALSGLDAFRLREITRWNAQIAQAERATAAQSVAAMEGGAPMEARFAAGWAAARRGEVTQAVALYRDVAQARRDLAGMALYDAGNALMREGERIVAAGDWVGARPLLELAKETYREALRLETGQWDARYNLERALRLAPEGEDSPTDPQAMGAESERSVTTMRAFTLGLP